VLQARQFVHIVNDHLVHDWGDQFAVDIKSLAMKQWLRSRFGLAKECRRFAAMTWKERDTFMAKPENTAVRERYEKHLESVGAK
jgi:hypothetical protein